MIVVTIGRYNKIVLSFINIYELYNYLHADIESNIVHVKSHVYNRNDKVNNDDI